MANIPLFQRNLILRTIGETCPLPDAHLAILQKWKTSLQSGSLNKIKEISLHGQFLTDLFGAVLGYTGITDGHGEAWEYQAEVSIPGAGQADAALGFLSSTTNRIVAPIELKGAMTSLDHPMTRGYTPVQQAWRYGNSVAGCRWVIVSNYRELRLYSMERTPAEYELFEIERLTDPAEYARLQLILGRDHFLAESGASRTEHLLAASGAAEKAITRKLYSDYRTIRGDLFRQLTSTNPEKDPAHIVGLSQKLLDRVLFIAFAEDVGLLPRNVLLKAFEFADPFNPRPVWENFKGLFRAVDAGNEALKIPRYNGGLFASDAELDALDVPDAVCEHFKRLAEYDFASEVSVTVLGHIFEQSITDLEAMKAEAAGEGLEGTGKRKQDGVYYTPDFITRFIVEETLGGYLRQKFEALKAGQTGRTSKAREIAFWEGYRDNVLRKIKVCDPACGSGAFLVAAFDFLYAEYRRVADSLHDLTGGYSLFDLNKTILTENLFGVDINSESVEITKLSLWLKTSEHGKPLTSLDANVRVGNSLLDTDFDWRSEFADVFTQGGFDIVLGNPPYVRMELIKPLKPYLSVHYVTHSDRADLYIYFFERGLNLLKESGRLGFIASGTFFKTGAGGPLRRFIRSHARVETIVDFGDMQVFEGATTYPAIFVMQKEQAANDAPLSFIKINGGSDATLGEVLTSIRAEASQAALAADGWQLEDEPLAKLRKKLMQTGRPVKEVCGAPLYGIKTGCNEAFVVDQITRDRLVAEDARSADLLRPFLFGRNLKRWRVEYDGTWIIYIPKGRIDIEGFPAIKTYLLPFRDKLESRATKQQWFELQQPQEAYEPSLQGKKIIYPDISDSTRFCLDEHGSYCETTCFFLAIFDWYVLAVLNSSSLWFCFKGLAPSVRGGFYRFKGQYVERLPIPDASSSDRLKIGEIAKQNHILAEQRFIKRGELCHRIASDLGGNADAKLNQKLQAWWELDFPAFRAEVKKCFKTDIPLAERSDWESFLTTEAAKVAELSRAITANEVELNKLVYALFNLNEEDILLIESDRP